MWCGTGVHHASRTLSEAGGESALCSKQRCGCTVKTFDIISSVAHFPEEPLKLRQGVDVSHQDELCQGSSLSPWIRADLCKRVDVKS